MWILFKGYFSLSIGSEFFFFGSSGLELIFSDDFSTVKSFVLVEVVETTSYT